MPLVYFIAGMLFIYFIVPLIEGFLSYLLSWFKKLETQETAEIYEIKQTVTAEDTPKVVGFVYEEEEEEE